MKTLRRALGKKRTLVGLGALAGLFVLLSMLSSAATGQAGKPAGGTAPHPAESPEDVPSPGIGGMAFKVIGSVLLLIGMLYAGVYGMKVLSRRTGRAGLASGAIRVLHKSHIAPKKAIYIVKVGRKAMVVGVTEAQISHLSDLTEEELGYLEAPDKPKGKSFKQTMLGMALGGGEKQ
jgi:flagellar biogenesis protein FliO